MSQKKITIPQAPIRFGLFASKPYAVWAVFSFIFVIAAQSLETSTYYIFKKLIDTALTFESGSVAGSAILLWIVLYPVAAVGHSYLYRASGFTAAKWFTGMQKYARDWLFSHLSLHSHTYFANRFAGSLNSKIWNASDGTQSLFEAFLWQYTNLLVAFGGSVFLVYLAHPLLALVYSFWVCLLIIVSYFLAKRNRKLSLIRVEERTKLTGLLVDVLGNNSAVRNFARRSEEIKNVHTGTNSLRVAALRAWLAGEFLLVVGNTIMGLFVTSMLAGSYFYWQHDLITTGDLVMILTLMSGLVGWFAFIGNSINSFAQSYGEAQEGLSELLIPHDITDLPNANRLAVSDGSISFGDVGFSYGPTKVFKNFSLSIKGGQRVGLVGPSGSGKSSFIGLLLRQHDVHEGSIEVDSQNIAQVSQDSLHEAIAVVPQEPVLFHRTLRENIAYGKPDATDEEVFEAARKAQIHDFITSLPEGYATMVGERGVKLSGGQRQRVAIARAILKAAPILILDEATSSLDSESEVEIQKALHELMQGKTVIAVAHRLSTIREMDRIIVLDQGNIVEDGSHDELLTISNGLYARLWSHQAGGFIQED